ncbi:MAG: hypothetical protein HYY29_00530, partial [Chloroflexi bacterium]|nr:hypothetical protein [Chloroflexota bacterium]
REEWGIFSYWLIDHGRGICFGRKPNCGGCFLNDICPMAFKVTSDKWQTNCNSELPKLKN